MLRNRDGFTLVELMIVMAVTVFVLAMASQVLTALVNQFKQQSKIAETSVESVVGLEIMRRDIQDAGNGLATGIFNSAAATVKYDVVDWSSLSGYSEVTVTNASAFNDAPMAPRAIIANNPSFSTINDSDYLAVKSAAVARNGASGKWHSLDYDGNKNTWDDGEENLSSTDRVIVISLRDKNNMGLVINGTSYSTDFNDTNDYKPSEYTDTHIIYGIEPGGSLTAPFNRADYYISDGTGPIGSSLTVPSRCAPGTGVLVKSVMQHDGSIGPELPLLDCVADMQVAYRDETGALDEVFGATAAEVRSGLRELKVYVLAHEGQKDPNFTFEVSSIRVGEAGIGRDFDLTAITDYERYRWKLYTLSEKPRALR